MMATAYMKSIAANFAPAKMSKAKAGPKVSRTPLDNGYLKFGKKKKG
jgi:hypothetical protein